MKVWALVAIVVVSCAASVAGGWAARGLSIKDRPQLVATPRIVEKCEKDVADVLLRKDSDKLNEGTKRIYAITTQECYEYGLVTDRYVEAIKDSQIGPYLDQYRANPNVWRQK